MPRGIIGSLVICTIFYVAVAAVFTGLISYDDLQTVSIADQAEPLTYALDHAAKAAGANIGWLNFANTIVAIGAVIATTAVLLVFQLGQPRIFFSMARDGLLPQSFAKLHPKFRTPHISTILTGLFVGVISGVSGIAEMVDLTNIGTLFAFILVCAGVIILRIKDPDRPRPFRVPGGLILPVLGIISCIWLMRYLPTTSWFRFAAWLNLGFVVYIAYGAVRSRLTGRDVAEDKAQHDAETAWSGATLGLAGLVVLFGALALDIFVRSHQPGGTDESLLNPSWFLIVPLIVNVILLFPPNILRAKRAIDAGVSGVHRQRSTISIALSGAMMLAGIAYLIVVLPNKF